MTHLASLLQASALALAVSSTLVHADTGTSRADVRAEYAMAAQADEMPSGFLARTTHDLYWNHVQSGSPSQASATPEQIRSDLFAAQQWGQIRTSFLGKTQQELAPANFASGNPAVSVSRDAVRAELMAAQAAGALPVGFAGRSLRDLYPGRYPSTQPTLGGAHAGSHISLNEAN